MKNFIIIGLIFGAGTVQATTPFTERVEIERSRQVINLKVRLDHSTVRCLVGDYSSQSLKITLPQIRPYTLFPQTTRGETAPCINAGSCLFDKNAAGELLHPGLIIDENRPVEEITVSVVLMELLEINHGARTCARYLREDIASSVRGMDFRHSDGGPIGSLDYDDCLRLAR